MNKRHDTLTLNKIIKSNRAYWTKTMLSFVCDCDIIAWISDIFFGSGCHCCSLLPVQAQKKKLYDLIISHKWHKHQFNDNRTKRLNGFKNNLQCPKMEMFFFIFFLSRKLDHNRVHSCFVGFIFFMSFYMKIQKT